MPIQTFGGVSAPRNAPGVATPPGTFLGSDTGTFNTMSISFVAPSSGKVVVYMRAAAASSNATGTAQLNCTINGVLQSDYLLNGTTGVLLNSGPEIVLGYSGLTPGASYTATFGVSVASGVTLSGGSAVVLAG